MVFVGDNELWVAIPGWPDYRINAEGKILSYRQSKRGRVLKPTPNEKGYLCVRLYRDSDWKQCKVHHLVALVFHGERPDGLVARHLDGNKLNNAAGNIEYGTHSQNNFEMVTHKTHKESTKLFCYRHHPLFGDNLRIDSKGVRRCKRCHADNIARYRARRKAGIPPGPRGRPRKAQ